MVFKSVMSGALVIMLSTTANCCQTVSSYPMLTFNQGKYDYAMNALVCKISDIDSKAIENMEKEFKNMEEDKLVNLYVMYEAIYHDLMYGGWLKTEVARELNIEKDEIEKRVVLANKMVYTLGRILYGN